MIPKNSYKRTLILNKNIIVIVVLSIFLSACGDWKQANWGKTLQQPVIKITKGNYSGFTSYPTRLEGIQDIEIRAKVNGYIQNIFVDEGQFVKKGQLLFQLEANVISQNTAASKAAIKSAKASVSSAKIEVIRLRPLVEKKIISLVQLQTAEAKLKMAKAQLYQAESNFKANKANQEYTNIVSPVDGILGKINFRKGALVGPATTLSLTTVSNTQQMYAYFSVGEIEITKMTKDISGKNLNEKLQTFPKLELELSDGTLYSLKGKLEVSTGKVSPKTGAIQLRAIFENPKGELLSGNTGLIKIPHQYKNRIAVPTMSTLNIQGIIMVYSLSEGDTLRMRPIQIGGEVDKFLIVDRGLETGEKILAQGLGKVYPNTVIIPTEVKMDSLVNSFQPLFK